MFRTELEELDLKTVQKFIEKHKEGKKRWQKLQEYYEGKHDILKSTKDANAPNNQTVNPYPRYITDMLTGHFMGRPVAYSAVDLKSEVDNRLMEELVPIFKYNDEQEENLELAKMCSIKGAAYEVLYMDRDSRVRFAMLDPSEVFFVYDTSLENRVRFAVRHFEQEVGGKSVKFIDIYSATGVQHFDSSSGQMALREEEVHYFGEVPVVLYENNKEQQGDFEPLISLIDAYDKAQSNTLNDMEQFTDAYLVLVNMSGTNEEDVEKLRKDRVLLMDKDGGAEWLIKSVNDAWVENYKTRLKRDIHKFSYTPDMTDENFGGNLSGVSLRYKLLAMEQVRLNKERKFKRGLQRRIELIANVLKITVDLDGYTGIDIRFNDTLPQNVLEISQLIGNLSPYLSTETLIEQLPFVENAAEEMEKKQAEEESVAELDYGSGFEKDVDPDEE